MAILFLNSFNVLCSSSGELFAINTTLAIKDSAVFSSFNTAPITAYAANPHPAVIAAKQQQPPTSSTNKSNLFNTFK